MMLPSGNGRSGGWCHECWVYPKHERWFEAVPVSDADRFLGRPPMQALDGQSGASHEASASRRRLPYGRPELPGDPRTRTHGSAYNVIIPAFPHAHTFGESVPEAMRNAREVIELELEAARERGDEIPPSDAEYVVIGTVTVSAARAVSGKLPVVTGDRLLRALKRAGWTEVRAKACTSVSPRATDSRPSRSIAGRRSRRER